MPFTRSSQLSYTPGSANHSNEGTGPLSIVAARRIALLRGGAPLLERQHDVPLPSSRRMKRSVLLKHLLRFGAVVVREGRRHTIVARGRTVTEVPRHREIVDTLACKVCRDLGIPFVR